MIWWLHPDRVTVHASDDDRPLLITWVDLVGLSWLAVACTGEVWVCVSKSRAELDAFVEGRVGLSSLLATTESGTAYLVQENSPFSRRVQRVPVGFPNYTPLVLGEGPYYSSQD